MRKKTISQVIICVIFLVGSSAYSEQVVGPKDLSKDLYDKGIRYYQEKQYDTAIETFREILSEYPDSEFCDNALYDIGKIYYDMKDYQQSINVFTKFIMDYPNSEFVEKANEKLEQMRTGTIIITSSPDRADVYIDGQKVGRTPFEKKELQVGEHIVKIIKEGYKSIEEKINVEDQKTMNLKLNLLKTEVVNKIGALVLNSKPDEALVKIGGKEKGRTPVTLEDMEEGEYEVSVEKEGYVIWAEKVKVTAGKVNTVVAEMNIKKSVINITTEPDSCEVIINDGKSEVSPVRGKELMPGEYKIRVVREGYKGYSEKIKAEPGKTYDINVVLEPEDAGAPTELANSPREEATELDKIEEYERKGEFVECANLISKIIKESEDEQEKFELKKKLVNVKKTIAWIRERIEENTAKSYGLLGKFYEEYDINKAEKCFEKAKLLEPEFAMLYPEIGLFYLRVGRLDESRDAFARFLKYEQDEKKHTLAKKYISAIDSEKNAKDAKGLMEVGEMYLKLNNSDRAIQIYEKAVSRYPEDTIALKNLALTYEKVKNEEKACEVWEKYIEIDPTDEFAKSKINKLKKDNLIRVKGGTFVQWNNFNHTVSSFYIGKYEVTYQLWYEVYQWAIAHGYNFANVGREGHDGEAGASPTRAKNEPVTFVNWRDCIVWCNAYSEKSGRTPVYYANAGFTRVIKDSRDAGFSDKINTQAGSCDEPYVNWKANGYRLPTEGEWEYASRYIDGANWTPGNYASGASADVTSAPATGKVAWYKENCEGVTHEVGKKGPNGLGIYDISGNVWEWCWDWMGNYPDTSKDYRGAKSGAYRVGRGGRWDGNADFLQVGYRGDGTPYVEVISGGFRLLRSR